jgi:hypothetical protein
MRVPASVLLSVSLLFVSYLGSADLKLQNERFPTEESALRVFSQGFSYDNSLKRLDQIDGFLESFRKLTELCRDRLSPEELRSVGNIGWEIQNLGFYNLPRVVEGTVRKQDYQLKKLEYELAKRKHTGGEINADQLTESRIAYKQSEAEFQAFWDSFRFRD